MNLLTENFNEQLKEDGCPKLIPDVANCGDTAISMFADREECNSPYVKACRDKKTGKDTQPSNIGPSECERDPNKDGCDPNAAGDDVTSEIMTFMKKLIKIIEFLYVSYWNYL